MGRYVLEGEYLEIIIELLGEKYRINSLIKLVFMSFCVRNGNRRSYMSRKRDFVDTFFSCLSVKFLAHSIEVQSIFEVIHMLKSSGWIKIEGDEIEVLKELNGFACNNNYLVGCRDMELNPIHEVNKLDSRAFAEEVLRHV